MRVNGVCAGLPEGTEKKMKNDPPEEQARVPTTNPP
jgi:hypothetical protein